MSADLRTAVKGAAPLPTSELDLASVERRARRITVVRAVGGSILAVVLLAAAVVVPRVLSEGIPVVPVGNDQVRSIPDGPRYEIASGSFGSGWGSKSAKRWRLLVWGEGDIDCWQLWVEGMGEDESLGCAFRSSDQIEDTIFGSRISFLADGDDPDEYQFISGEVGPRVDALEIREDGEPPVVLEIYQAPRQAGVPLGYYAATLPAYDYAQVVALDHRGEELDTHNLCGLGCKDDKAAEEQSKIDSYERRPVAVDAKAAVVGIAGVGKAGLLDHFGTFYDYDGSTRAGDAHRLRFRVSQCPAPAAGGYSCEPGGFVYLTVSQRGDRLVITDATGDLTDDHRRALVGYGEGIPSDDLDWRPVSTSIAKNKGQPGWGIGLVMAWTGNIPGPVRDYGSMCSFVALGADGGVLHRSRPFPVQVGPEEQDRNVGPLTGLESRRGAPESIEISCDEPRVRPH